ncbi:MAG: hypothetical protein M3Z04_03720 [Chloroflexota bacterium]|nr:hypothetical protein [Chloroflexota bacterium]
MQHPHRSGLRAALIGTALIALTGSAGTAPAAQAQAAAPLCRTWVAQPQTDPLAAGYIGPQSLAVLSPSDIWTAGTTTDPAGGSVRAQIHHWDGTAWTNMPLPRYDGAFDTLFALAAIAPNDIWAVGPRVLHWNGAQWQTVAAPLGSLGELHGVAASGPNNVWAVGRISEAGQSHNLTIHWDGQQWNRIPIPEMAGGGPIGLQAVAVLSAGDVWAVSNTNDEQALVAHWDGNAWSRVDAPHPPGSDLHAITALAADDIWAVGEAMADQQNLDAFVLHWDGHTWSRNLTPSFQDQPGRTKHLQVTGVAARNPQDVWLIANQNGEAVGLARWTGNSWARSRNPLPNSLSGEVQAGRIVAAGGGLWAVSNMLGTPPHYSQSAILRYGAGPCTANRSFPETGHTVTDPLLAYWEEHGALAQQGYPLTELHAEASPTDGKMYQTQYFERAVFEQHPENTPPYDILLSLLGVEAYTQRYGAAGAPGQHVNTDRARLFPETGHTVGGDFRLYWEAHGGLAQQGYPISEEFQERNALNGQTYTVQYFQRAVFEYHPENAGTPYVVLLSQLGRFAAQRRGLLAP